MSETAPTSTTDSPVTETRSISDEKRNPRTPEQMAT